MPDRLRHIDILGTPVACATYASALEEVQQMAVRPRPGAVCASNTHIISQARHDESFGVVMRNFDLVLPDGMPLVWYLNRKQAGLEDRVYGPYFMKYTLEHSPPRLRHFFFGGKQSTLDRLVDTARELNPEIQIAGTYSPPFRAWTEEDEAENARVIRESGADLIWVALGGERQERWIYQNLNRHEHGVFLAVGDAFELLAGNRPFAPDWIQKRGLTWLYRLLQEPRRLWPRYFKYNSLFLWYLALETFGLQKQCEGSKVQKWESKPPDNQPRSVCRHPKVEPWTRIHRGPANAGQSTRQSRPPAAAGVSGINNLQSISGRKPRIAFIGSRGVPAQYSGFETLVAELGKCLVRRGYDITVYNRNEHYLEHFTEYEGMKIRWLPTIRTKSLDTPIHTVLSLLDALFRHYDIIYLCGVGNAPLSRLLPRLAGAKLMINVDGADYRRAKWGPLGRLWLRRSEREAIKVADSVIADNPEILDRYERLYGYRPSLISYGTPIGCDYAHTRILESLGIETQKYFLFVGRITPENEAHLAIAGYLRFLSQRDKNGMKVGRCESTKVAANQPRSVCRHPKVEPWTRIHRGPANAGQSTINNEQSASVPKLVIVGSEGYEKEYMASLRELAAPAGENILFAGGRYGDAYRELSDHALAFVLPAQIEATRLVLLDQMGFGSCILFRDCEATRHVIGGAGIPFGPPATRFHSETTILGSDEDPMVRDSAVDLGNKLEQVCADEALRKEKAEAARQRAIEKFSWEAVADQYEDVFEKLLINR